MKLTGDDIANILKLLVMLGQAVSSLDYAIRNASNLPAPTLLPESWEALIVEPSAGDQRKKATKTGR